MGTVQRLLSRPAAATDEKTARAVQIELARLVALRVDIELYPYLTVAARAGRRAYAELPT
ncbi:MAG: hypothetical protein M3336_08845 [Chloroflexota bacterium]|nr:hypothetical protein [Chloroflexota bacterium]